MLAERLQPKTNFEHVLTKVVQSQLEGVSLMTLGFNMIHRRSRHVAKCARASTAYTDKSFLTRGPGYTFICLSLDAQWMHRLLHCSNLSAIRQGETRMQSRGRVDTTLGHTNLLEVGSDEVLNRL